MAQRKRVPPAPNSGGVGEEFRKAPARSPLTPPSGAVAPELGAGGTLLLSLLILAYLLLAFGYSAVTPAATADQHNPDENAHVQYVATLASGHLPVFTDAAHGYENHQPPLYYALCAPVYLATHGRGDAGATRALRVVSMLLGALLILVTYGTVRRLFPEEPALALGTAAFVALLPGNVALGASVTNDSLTTLVIALALWQLVGLLRTLGPDVPPAVWRRRALWLGLTLGVGIWTKTLTLSLFPTVLVSLLWLARTGRVSGAVAAQAAGLAVGLGLLFGAPWLGRNTLLYGDPLAQNLLLNKLNNGESNVTLDVMAYVFGGIGPYFAKVAQWGFASFWGGFDSMRLFWDMDPHKAHPNFGRGPTTTYLALLAVSAVAAVGLVLPRSGSDAARQPALLALAAQAVFTGILFLDYNLHFFQAQGRYLYPALLPLAFFFVWGWRRLVPARAFPVFLGIMVVGLLGLNAYTIFGLLMPRFAG